MLTLFTTPKPFRESSSEHQYNALRSWTLLRPECEIILFGDEEGAAEAAAELKLRHIPGVARSEYGLPLLNDLFEQARQSASRPLIGFVNADIILLSDFMEAVAAVAAARERFLMVGRRWNIDLKGALSFDPGWESRLREAVYHEGELFAGIDYFVFPRDLWGPIPPLVVGRVNFDNWPLYGARFRRAQVIDATQVVTAVHQNHPQISGTQHAAGLLETNKNLKMLGGHLHRFTAREATHQLTPQGLKVRCRECRPVCVCSGDFFKTSPRAMT